MAEIRVDGKAVWKGGPDREADFTAEQFNEAMARFAAVRLKQGQQAKALVDKDGAIIAMETADAELRTALAMVADLVEVEAERMEEEGEASACIAVEYREAMRILEERLSA